jgi:murein L,D-transpeptidase YafK
MGFLIYRKERILKRIQKILTITVLLLFVFQTILYSDIPSSSRSRKVIQKQKPILETELEKVGIEYGSSVFIRIIKQKDVLELWMMKNDKYELFKSYEICYYSGSLGPKLKEGDLQSPEGFYRITPSSLNPYSSYHLSFDIGYPNTYDRFYKRTGSAIAVHGACVSVGCFAMTDAQIEEIYTLIDAAFRNGQNQIQVHIFPFDITKKNMQIYKESKWIEFWQNLKEGYDIFEKTKVPQYPKIQRGKYIFNI